MVQIVRAGRWRYDDDGFRSVDVVALPYDWHHLAGEDRPIDGVAAEPTPLGPEGVLYYARFKDAGRTDPTTWVDGVGRSTIDEAVADAEARATAPIEWGVAVLPLAEDPWWFEDRPAGGGAEATASFRPRHLVALFVVASSILVFLGIYGLLADPGGAAADVLVPLALIGVFALVARQRVDLTPARLVQASLAVTRSWRWDELVAVEDQPAGLVVVPVDGPRRTLRIVGDRTWRPAADAARVRAEIAARATIRIREAHRSR